MSMRCWYLTAGCKHGFADNDKEMQSKLEDSGNVYSSGHTSDENLLNNEQM